ncbi:asparaginase [Aliiroseovarius sp. KMU-50]|uniref:Asparaginase n=1 Tax=Aliiroseovarius salicola TaxID=3009082 RepID=A0ABT4VWX5_9RHOB|nr:asparaginase [Aliiroseovarius sp. KMU-50]MDA5092744.1 asparaginase [Aliiroseovarius sp. KMU-50]
MVEIWRGPFMESQHWGHAVVVNANGEVIESWGNPDEIILPRSSAKMLQALPLVESGAADAAGLTPEQLALACASHDGAAIHTDRVRNWLGDMGLGEDDLCCGPQLPDDRPSKKALICAGEKPCRIHNNCSGKHAGFLTLARHLGADIADYVNPDHAVQQAAKLAFEEVTGLDTPGFGIDGCSAPNFATSLSGMGRAMAAFAAAEEGRSARDSAMVRLREAMMAHPDLVAGEGRACTELMRATPGKVAVKTGAEAFFIAILPEQKLGVALKISDGSTRASECAIAAILARLGVADPSDPMVQKRLAPRILSRAGEDTGGIRPVAELWAG